MVICTTILAAGITGCTDEEKPVEPAFSFRKPVNFPEPVYTFENNPLTKDGFELGRRLFYDPILSSDGTISCSSCHQPVRAFSDPAHVFSIGVENRMGNRNAPPIFNLAFQKFFFWDGGVNHLDFVPINPIENELEMNSSLSSVLERLNQDDYYSGQFRKVFGKDTVDSRQMLHAMSQFLLMLVSDNSSYDKYIRNEGYLLSASEARGLNLFGQKCAHCHATDLFSDGSFRNNGLDPAFSNDPGRSRITESGADLGKFKVPSLRNIALTEPYMHDGRFASLQEVLDHYSDGVQYSPTLDPFLNQEGTLGIPLSEQEKQDIIAFLLTLTDESFIGNSQFYDPF